jgi:hypothetical protein
MEHQRLAWARLVAANSGTSSFWATLRAADAYLDSSGGDAPSPSSRVTQAVRVTRLAASALAPALRSAEVAPYGEGCGFGAFADLPGVVGGTLTGAQSRTSGHVVGRWKTGGRKEQGRPVTTPQDDLALEIAKERSFENLMQSSPDYLSLVAARMPCCCIARGIEVDVEDVHSMHQSGRVSSLLKVYLAVGQGDANSKPCTLSWSEFTTVAYAPASGSPTVPAWKWVDLSHHPAFLVMAKETLAALEDPCPEGLIPVITDRPGAPPPRFLAIRVTLSSGCDSSSMTKYVVQTIDGESASVDVKSEDALLDFLWRHGAHVTVR